MKQVRCISIIFKFFYGILSCRNHTSWIKLIFAFMHALCVDNTGQFMHGSFIVFSSKTEKEKKPTGARLPWQVCKTGVLFSILLIWKMIDFSWEFIFSLLTFYIQENPIEVSYRYVLMGILYVEFKYLHASTCCSG